MIIKKYILKQFLLTTIFSLIAFASIFIIIDMMENLEDFLDNDVEFSLIVNYYIVFLPEIIKLMTPVAVLFSSMFTIGKMNLYFELPAIVSSGVSLYQIIFPILISTIVLSFSLLYFNGWIVPIANQNKLAIERKYLHTGFQNEETTNLFFQIEKSTIMSISQIEKNTAHKVSIQIFDEKTPKLLERFDANEMKWNEERRKWTLYKINYRDFQNENDKISYLEKMEFEKIKFSPDDLIKKQRKPEEMNFYELKKYISTQEKFGNNVSKIEVDYYGKIAFPFACIIVVLFGVTFSSVRKKGGLGIEFGIATGVCFLYMVLLKISQVFGYNGDINPILTAWSANIFFLLFALIILLLYVKK